VGEDEPRGDEEIGGEADRDDESAGSPDVGSIFGVGGYYERGVARGGRGGGRQMGIQEHNQGANSDGGPDGDVRAGFDGRG